MNHDRVASINLADTTGDVRGISQEEVDAIGGTRVPAAQPMQQPAGISTLQSVLQAALAQVLRLQVPGVAHWRMHVADMELVRPGNDALGDRMIAGDDDVVA